MDQLLATSDAAKILNRSVDSVRGYERAGKLPAQRMKNGQRIFKVSDVERLAARLLSRQARNGEGAR